jgi:RimJ/RimL family protein N-acetyltransferase
VRRAYCVGESAVNLNLYAAPVRLHADAVSIQKPPTGFLLPNWEPPPHPPREPMIGRYCRVEPADPARHAKDLYRANEHDRTGDNFTYLAYGPFDSFDAYLHWLEPLCRRDDPLFHAIVDGESGQAVGIAAYLRIDTANGVIEVGHLNYSPLLQRKRAATEAMYLMMKRAFELGYRRYEWKCDVLNAPSRAAALRLGFTFEGVFRQAVVYKKRNRDTAWYSILDREWPRLEQAYARWLAPDNFDGQGRQRLRLSDLMRGG